MRSLRSVGMFVALVIMSSSLIAAATASAATFVSGNGEYPIIIFGSQFQRSEFSHNSIVTTCAPQSGEEWGSQAGPARSASLTASNATCSGSQEALEMNGCEFTFRPGTGGAGAMELGPPGCGPMVLAGGCELRFGPQKFEAHNENLVEKEQSTVLFHVNTSLKFTYGSGCGTSGEGSATYKANWQLLASHNGNHVGLKTISSGIYLGRQFGEAATFQSEMYPTAVVGEQESGNYERMILGPRTFSCASAEMSGELSAASENVSLSPTYSNCMANGLPTKIQANSCRFNLNVLNTAPPYTADFGVVCAEEGDAIEASVWSTRADMESGQPASCIYRVGPQSGLEGVALENVGAGVERSVVADFGVTGLAYTMSGNLLLCGRSSGVGSYAGAATLHGF